MGRVRGAQARSRVRGPSAAGVGGRCARSGGAQRSSRWRACEGSIGAAVAGHGSALRAGRDSGPPPPSSSGGGVRQQHAETVTAPTGQVTGQSMTKSMTNVTDITTHVDVTAPDDDGTFMQQVSK